MTNNILCWKYFLHHQTYRYKTYFPHQKLCHLLIDNVADILKPSQPNLTEAFTKCFFAKSQISSVLLVAIVYPNGDYSHHFQ